jgi:hypothetical protein
MNNLTTTTTTNGYLSLLKFSNRKKAFQVFSLILKSNTNASMVASNEKFSLFVLVSVDVNPHTDFGEFYNFFLNCC